MTALAQNTDRPLRDGHVIAGVQLQASATVYQGALLEIDARGHVKGATKAANKTYFGIAETAGAAGATGTVTIDVRRRATAHFKTSGTAVRGKEAYVVDDQTVTDAPANASKVGRIVDTDDDGVWVELYS